MAHEKTASEGRIRDSAGTVQSCSRVCLEKSDCDGFDWEHGSPSGSQCWLTGTWTTEQRENVKGTTHFYRRCAGNYSYTLRMQEIWTACMLPEYGQVDSSLDFVQCRRGPSTLIHLSRVGLYPHFKKWANTVCVSL